MKRGKAKRELSLILFEDYVLVVQDIPWTPYIVKFSFEFMILSLLLPSNELQACHTTPKPILWFLITREEQKSTIYTHKHPKICPLNFYS